MADWLKVNHRLVRSAKIRQLANELRVKKHAALGAALCWLIWVDEQTTDGKTGLSPEDVDDELGFRGLAAALQSIGWASMEAGCLVATDFEKHCGATAKKRAEDSRRQSEKREKDRIKSREERDRCHGKSVTDVTGSALPEKKRIYISRKGEHSTTVDIEPAAGPCPRPPDGFGEWLQAIGPVVPMLRRLNLDAPLPRAVEAAARQAAELVRLTPEVLDQLGRYYGAEAVQTYRPDALEHFFGNLPDVLQHAENWCRADDRARRKAEATARRRAQEAERSGLVKTPGCKVKRCGGVLTEEDKAEFFREVRG